MRPDAPFESKVLPILVDSLADRDAPNAQMTNARDIIAHLDPARFQVSVFHRGEPDPKVAARPNTRLIPLPASRQTVPILREFLFGRHAILFYVKPSPAARVYLALRKAWKDGRAVVGTVESQSDLRNEPTIAAETVRMWERTVLRSDYLFSNSEFVRRSLRQNYGLPSEVVPTGVDTAFFQPAPTGPPRARPRVLFVGSLRPFKQPDLLLDAAARFPLADFAIAGGGPMAPELRSRIQRERLANATLAGALTPREVLLQYQSSDVLLFPSRWEGSPRVILEAAACGLPVVARSDYGVETVVHGETGFLGDSPEALLRYLERLLAAPELIREMGRRAREYVRRFDWSVITRQWEDIFTRIGRASGEKS